MVIEIAVRERRVRAPAGAFLISCNSDCRLRFSFDSEWDALPQKTARLRFHCGNRTETADYPLTANECSIRVPAGADCAEAGIDAGETAVTEAAILPVFRSILDPETPHLQEPADLFQQMLAQLNGDPLRRRSAHCLGSSSGAFLCTDTGSLLMTKEESHDT